MVIGPSLRVSSSPRTLFVLASRALASATSSPALLSQNPFVESQAW